MKTILVESNPSKDRLEELGVRKWPIWTKEVSEFPWFYDEQEICYFLEGEIEVTPESGQPVKIKKGDLVTFPQGLSCRWKVIEPVRKHYKFG
ncbi:MAG TPA: cupin domain-containing protein [Candidatus Marinimicrobia bacterium]|nr:cupin domain-containing protein [Candidatus Neomarinimicrobiota bacterium]HRS51046.1 cupin domain-containing protein [Candidatus Neomarinimicrobiota bacterium]HRU92553.1 cupin domain-containing protein [Candidatus Neomarinimicrobiota bacterium]